MRPRNGDGTFRDQHPADRARIKELEANLSNAESRISIAIADAKTEKARAFHLQQVLGFREENIALLERQISEVGSINAGWDAKIEELGTALKKKDSEWDALAHQIRGITGLRFWTFITLQSQFWNALDITINAKWNELVGRPAKREPKP